MVVAIVMLLTMLSIRAQEKHPVAPTAASAWTRSTYSQHFDGPRGGVFTATGPPGQRKIYGDGVQLGDTLPETETRASLARGGDGVIATFKGAGYISPEGVVVPASPAMTYYMRVQPTKPGGLWHTPQFSLVLHESGLLVGIVGMVDDKGRMQVEIPLSPLSLNEWHDVIVRYDAQRLELFVDGRKLNRIPLTSSPEPVIPGPLLIGSWRIHESAAEKAKFSQGALNWLYERPLSGSIDHFGIWNRTLSDAEVAALSGVTTITPLPPVFDSQQCLSNYRDFFAASRASDVLACERLALGMRTYMAKDPRRPIYHLTAPMDVIFDPAGAYFYKGKYHVFSYRNMVSLLGCTPLAHYVSDDLIHWKDKPIAVWPDTEMDVQGIWLGNIFLDDKQEPRMLYTALGTLGKIGVLARGSGDDLLTFIDKKAVMTDVVHHDGHTWKEGDTWYSITTIQHWGRRLGDAGDALHLFTSPNLEKWTDRGEFFTVKKIANSRDHHQREGFAEFPYVIPFGDKHALMVGTRPVRYWMGRFDKDKPAFIPDEPEGKLLDYLNPFHCFNPSIVDHKGPGGTERRIILAMNRDPAGSVDGIPWYGIHVLPRVLTREGDRLRQEPVPEVEALRGKHVRQDRTAIPAGAGGLLPGVSGDTLEIDATFEPGSAQRFGLKVRMANGSAEGTKIYYDVKSGEFGVEGRLEKPSPYPEQGHAPAYLQPGAPVRLRVFLDRSSLEVFVNGQAMSGTPSSKPEAVGVDLFSEGGEAVLKSLDAWEMKPAFAK